MRDMLKMLLTDRLYYTRAGRMFSATLILVAAYLMAAFVNAAPGKGAVPSGGVSRSAGEPSSAPSLEANLSSPSR